MYLCTLTADGWQLYTCSKNCTAAVEAINSALTTEVRAALELLKAEPCLSEARLARQIRDRVYLVMDRYVDLGARDSEPEGALVAEIERALGLDCYALDR